MIFLFRKKEQNDRDCCAYIKDNPMRFECDHYFGYPCLEGCCYSEHAYPNYKEIDTVLTEEEYNQLVQFAKDIDELGCGIKKGDTRYEQGLSLCKNIQPVYDKLKSEEAQEFFEKIKESEKEYLMSEYNLTYCDVETIFNEYDLDYRDRSIVRCVYDDAEELGNEEAFQLGYVPGDDTSDPRYRFFNFEEFGEWLVHETEGYLELSNGRIVSMNY